MYCRDCVYLMCSGCLPWHRLIWLPMVAIWGHLLKKLLCLITFLVHECSFHGHVTYHLGIWIQSIAEELDFQPRKKFMMWNFLINPIYLSQSSYMLSDSSWVKVVRFAQSFAALDGGKYFVRNLFAISSHVAMIFLGKELNHVFALFFKEKRKSFSFITFGDTPLILCVSYISRKIEMCSLGSSCGNPPNWYAVSYTHLTLPTKRIV